MTKERGKPDGQHGGMSRRRTKAAAPATIPLKTILAASALKGHVAAIGDCNGTFCQSLLNPDGTERKVWIELPEKKELGHNYIWEAVSASLGFKGVPKTWNTHNTNDLTNSVQMEQL